MADNETTYEMTDEVSEALAEAAEIVGAAIDDADIFAKGFAVGRALRMNMMGIGVKRHD